MTAIGDAPGHGMAGGELEQRDRAGPPLGVAVAVEIDVEQLPIQGLGHVTNCCFGGDDLRTLYATEAIPGRVVAWEDMPTPGLPLSPWRA